MAKYRDKIENERVAGNPIGEAVLNRLLADLRLPPWLAQTVKTQLAVR
jgi:hypothetical protein